MNPDLSLAIVGWLAAFVLRTTLAFGVCLIVSRLVTSASHRFILWAGFLYGSAAYWLYLAGKLLAEKPLPGSSVISVAPPVGFAAALNIPESWNVPLSWAGSLAVALGVLGLVYGLVLVYVVLSHANQRRHLRWVMGFATQPPADISATFQLLSKNLGMHPPQLLMLSGASSPATFGWLRPVVLLPALSLELDGSNLEDILLHELHHVRRRDSFWNALAIAARGVVCFHPAAWYAMRKMQFDRELACDLAVISRSPARKGMYAESLLRFARLNLAKEPAGWGIDFAASSQHLAVRVRSILTEASIVSPWLFWLRTGLGFALLAAFVGVAPSLGILLGYSHPMAPPTVSAVVLRPADEQKAVRTGRRPRALSSPPAAVTNATAPASSQTEGISPQAADRTEGEVQTTLATEPGPHLQHRTSDAGRGAANSTVKPQAIGLINDGDSGQSGKHGDSSQTVQQSATVAAAIWKRVGDLDRR